MRDPGRHPGGAPHGGLSRRREQQSGAVGRGGHGGLERPPSFFSFFFSFFPDDPCERVRGRQPQRRGLPRGRGLGEMDSQVEGQGLQGVEAQSLLYERRGGGGVGLHRQKRRRTRDGPARLVVEGGDDSGIAVGVLLALREMPVIPLRLMDPQLRREREQRGVRCGGGRGRRRKKKEEE